MSVGERGWVEERMWEKRVVNVVREKMREELVVEVVDTSLRIEFDASCMGLSMDLSTNRTLGGGGAYLEIRYNHKLSHGHLMSCIVFSNYA